MENNRLIELKNVSKEFDGELALNDVSLYVRDEIGRASCRERV